MSKPKVHVLEIVPDAELKRKEKAATRAVERILLCCGPVRLYRTSEDRFPDNRHR